MRSYSALAVRSKPSPAMAPKGDGSKVWDSGAEARCTLADAAWTLEARIPFVIRQVGNRTVYFKGEAILVETLAKSVHLGATFRVQKMGKHRRREETYRAGIVSVQLTQVGPSLWLMVTHRKGKGRFKNTA